MMRDIASAPRGKRYFAANAGHVMKLYVYYSRFEHVECRMTSAHMAPNGRYLSGYDTDEFISPREAARHTSYRDFDTRRCLMKMRKPISATMPPPLRCAIAHLGVYQRLTIKLKRFRDELIISRSGHFYDSADTRVSRRSAGLDMPRGNKYSADSMPSIMRLMASHDFLAH